MAAPDPNPKLGLDELAAKYGYAASFFQSDPELRGVINRAVAEQWTPDRFRAEFMNTAWYRNGEDSRKQAAELKARNPGEYNAQIERKTSDLQQQAQQSGINVGYDRLRQLAETSIIWGWNDSQMQGMLAAEFKYTGDASGGAAGTEMSVKRMAADYGVNLSDTQIGDYIGGILGGRYTQDGLRDLVKDQAVSRYPGLQDRLNQGFTVRQIASPYISSYATILEQDADSVQLTDPLIQKALQGTPAQAGQAPAATTVYDFEQSLRSDPRWLGTKNARNDMKNVALQIGKDWGLVG